MAQTITEEQKQLLLQTTLQGGMNAWEYIQSQNEANRPWVAAGILSLLKKGRPLNRLTVFWEAEDLRNPPKKDERPLCQYAPSKELKEKLTEEQKQLLQQTMLDNGMNAWEYMLTRPKDSQPWIIAGILSCMKKGYGMTLLEISWEARDLRYAPKMYERPMRQHAPSKELEEKLTEMQREQLMATTLENDMNAWEYVLSWRDDDQYWIALGILSCVKHGYSLNRLTINWEARDLRYATKS